MSLKKQWTEHYEQIKQKKQQKKIMSDIIKSYKGFDKDLCCSGFQYEVGKEYEIESKIKCCQKGFHACESPFEVFDHYDMLTSRFC